MGFPEGTAVDLVANDEDALVFIDVPATEYGEGGFEDDIRVRSTSSTCWS